MELSTSEFLKKIGSSMEEMADVQEMIEHGEIKEPERAEKNSEGS